MFRVADFFMVLIVAASPSATLLCKSSCDPQVAAPTACHEADASSSPSVAVSDDGCDEVALSAVALLREGVRRGISSPEGEHAILVPRYQLARLTTGAPLGYKPGRDSPLERRPLKTALRI